MIKLASAVAAALLGLAPASSAAVLSAGNNGSVLSAGTNLEVRLSSITGSRVSHSGDPIEATVIAPVFQANRLLLPKGTTISGSIASVQCLGLGLRYGTASVEYRFESLRLPDGRAFPIKTVVREVETAKERVDESGLVGGIYPTANLSSGASLVISALVAEPHIAVTMLAVKFLIARSPDPEIYFPAGTEMVVQLKHSAEIPDLDAASDEIAPMTEAEVVHVRHLLESLPQQQAERAQNRASDLVNILFLGTHDQIQRAFHAAGWTGEQRRSVLALYRMYHCMVQRVGYRMAPMSILRLNGAIPAVAFQKSLDTFSKRHHVRIWHQEDSDAWLGAATEDTGYMFQRMHVTHATDPDIDNERAKVVNDLWFTGCLDAASLVSRESLKLADPDSRSIVTDSGIAVLRLNDCRDAQVPQSDVAKPGQHPRSRIVQALAAVGTDIIRSNPISLAYNATKSLPNSSAVRNDELGFLPESRPRQRATPAIASDTIERYKRRRLSVIDAGMQPPLSKGSQLQAFKIATQAN